MRIVTEALIPLFDFQVEQRHSAHSGFVQRCAGSPSVGCFCSLLATVVPSEETTSLGPAPGPPLLSSLFRSPGLGLIRHVHADTPPPIPSLCHLTSPSLLTCCSPAGTPRTALGGGPGRACPGAALYSQPLLRQVSASRFIPPGVAWERITFDSVILQLPLCRRVWRRPDASSPQLAVGHALNHALLCFCPLSFAGRGHGSV